MSAVGFMVPNVVIDEFARHLEVEGLAIYCLLTRLANEEHRCWPSLAFIEEKLHLSRPTVVKYLGRIVECGLAIKEDDARGRSVTYYLRPLREEPAQIEETSKARLPVAEAEPSEPAQNGKSPLLVNAVYYPPETEPVNAVYQSGGDSLLGSLLRPPTGDDVPSERPLVSTQETATECVEPALTLEFDTRTGKPRKDYTGKIALDIAVRHCCEFWRSEYGRLRPKDRVPAINPRAKQAVRDTLKAVREADGGDWLEAENETKRLIGLLFFDRDGYTERSRYDLACLSVRLNALRTGATDEQDEQTGPEYRSARGRGGDRGPYPAGRGGGAGGDDEQWKLWAADRLPSGGGG